MPHMLGVPPQAPRRARRTGAPTWAWACALAGVSCLVAGGAIVHAWMGAGSVAPPHAVDLRACELVADRFEALAREAQRCGFDDVAEGFREGKRDLIVSARTSRDDVSDELAAELCEDMLHDPTPVELCPPAPLSE